METNLKDAALGDQPILYVRSYQESDREAVFAIAADTAYFGAPVEAFLEDRRLFCDIFYAYYTDYEPQSGWVACARQADSDQVVGFLMGCNDTSRRGRIWVTKILPWVTRRILTGRYRMGRRTAQYAIGEIKAVMRRELPGADLSLYPAHLHINLQAAWRGCGLGKKLIAHYVEQLRYKSVPGIHLHTTSLNEAACKLYERSGFCLLAKHTTRLWKRQVDREVENRIYGLKIEQGGDERAP
jgi:ribosomal protein S18 acetylase RimI-like enzyme